MGRFASRLGGLRLRLQATRRVWSLGPVIAGGIDLPEPGAAVGAGILEVDGWALLPSGPPIRVDAWLDDIPLGRARLGLPRPDVRRALDAPVAVICGFELAADLSLFEAPAGEALLRIVATGAAGETIELDPVPVLVGEEAPPDGPEEITLPSPPLRTPHAPERPGHRLLVCTHRLDLGGAQLYLFELVRELLRLEAANPTVVTSVDGPLRPQLEDLEVPVHVSSPFPTYDRGAYIGRVEELAVWAEPRRFDLAFINTASSYAFPGAEVAAQLGIPALWAIHESYRPRALWADLHPKVLTLAEEALGRASLAIFEAESTKRLYESRLPDRCLTLPYGVALDCIDAERVGFDPLVARREAGIDPDAEVVLCVGAIEPRKAQVPLVQAFASIAARHPRAHLVLLGGWGDAASSALAAYIEACASADRISLVPLSADVQRWHGIADILVCPSDLESLPRAVLEAMAWEKPVLATDVFGLPDVVDDGATGWLCPCRDIEELSKALERALASTPGERAALGRAGRALIERSHTLDAYARRFAGVLDEVARETSSPSGAGATPSWASSNGARAQRVSG